MAKGDGAGGATDLGRSPSHLLHRALQRALDVYGEEAGAAAPTQRQFALLAAAGAGDGRTQTELVKATGIDRSTLADLVARMLAKGWLARERSASDARANAVRLTDAGRAVLADAAPRASTADARILAPLGPKARERFLAALTAVADGSEPSEGKPKPDKRKKKKAKKAKAAEAPTPEA